MGHRAKNKMITAKEAIQTVRIFKLQLITAKLPCTRQRRNQMVATLECKILIDFKTKNSKFQANATAASDIFDS